jgi:glycosyltransferase involved in cell wall biosynthesis
MLAMCKQNIEISVIIPTYNRKDSLLRTLQNLQLQTYRNFEVIVVDDGGNDGTEMIAQHSFQFPLSYIYQENKGDSQARNTGVQNSQSPYVVFQDDDITLDKDCLGYFLETLQTHRKSIALGNLITVKANTDEESSTFHKLFEEVFPKKDIVLNGCVPFTECLSGFMGVARQNYIDVGMMKGLTTQDGANTWCDVDFGYRAFQQGLQVYRSSKIIGFHHDQSMYDFARYCRQQEKVGRLGVLLLQKHPQLKDYLPALIDKEPIQFGKDSPLLIIDKLFHKLTSYSITLRAMQKMVVHLEQNQPTSSILILLYRWILSAYLFRGYRNGLKQYKSVA